MTTKHDLKAIPDIWSNGEKYGDRIALVDRYHNPPFNIDLQSGKILFHLC